MEDRDARLQLEFYNNVVKKAKAHVDCQPSHSIPFQEQSIKRAENEIHKSEKLEAENRIIVQGISKCLRRRGSYNRISLTPKITSDNMRKEARQIRLLNVTKENYKIMKKIEEKEPVYSTKAFLEEWKKKEKNIQLQAHYPLFWLIKDPDIIDSRSRCYFDITIPAEGRKVGRLKVLLYDDIVPKTVANFLTFCIGRKCLQYRFCPFYQIIPGLLCKTGDIMQHNGMGGASIYGETFDDENFQLKHSNTGILSMVNDGPNTNNSKFQITFKPVPLLDGKNVVFGKVIEGLQALQMIEAYGFKTGKPKATVIIEKCGVLRRKL